MAVTTREVLNFIDEPVKAAMLRGLQDHVRDQLREILMQEVDKIVDNAVAGFEANLHAYVNHGRMNPTLAVVIDYRFTKREG
jgi:hypothetical protein